MGLVLRQEILKAQMTEEQKIVFAHYLVHLVFVGDRPTPSHLEFISSILASEEEKYITGQNQPNIDAYNEMQEAIKANDEARIAAGAEALNALGAEFKDPLGLGSRLSAPTWLERRMPRINPPKIVLPNIKLPHIEAPKGWEIKF